MIDFILKPWPWYVAGPLIGLTVPVLLLIGNKSFGISSSLRHVCASCFPAKIPFFEYEWKKEIWNLFFVLGIFIGGVLAAIFLSNPEEIVIAPELIKELQTYGLTSFDGLLPQELFSWESLTSVRGFIILVFGGFLVGFGSRYAGGCTSGHAIMGLSTLQWPSLIATICFMIGGFIMVNIILPLILKL